MSKDLDTLVTYAQAAGITAEQLDEAVHEDASGLASATNNAGLADQIGFLCSTRGAAGVAMLLEGLADAAIESLGDQRYVVEHSFDAEPTYVCMQGPDNLDKPAVELSADIPVELRLEIANLARVRLNFQLLSEKAAEST